ncbi:MAG: sugar ABC transporter permease, partial [Propionicimonas sp.]|nr:sugar ABC transporter permease [Propionicimonas sp.]
AFLLILGAMEQIDIAVYEAARIDGAGYWAAFWSITVPLIRPVLAITLLLELIWNFNGFTVIWALTQGGPGYATSTLPVLVYRTAFQQIDFGLGSAMAVMGGVILTLVGVAALRLSASRQG